LVSANKGVDYVFFSDVAPTPSAKATTNAATNTRS
jgi:thiamine monophosphate synthase